MSTSPVTVVIRAAITVVEVGSVLGSRRRSKASFLRISLRARSAALVRLPSRINSTRSTVGHAAQQALDQRGTDESGLPVMAIFFPESDAAITVDSSSRFVYQLVEKSFGDGRPSAEEVE